MTVKRAILLVITIVALIPVFLSLINSINQPQVQANLQLYQTNLVLQASEFPWENHPGIDLDLSQARNAFLGQDPYKIAQNQYEEAIELSEKNLEYLESQSLNLTLEEDLSEKSSSKLFFFIKPEKLVEEIRKQQESIDKLNLKLGILEAQQGENKKALKTWNQLKSPDSLQNTANILTQLWSKSPQILPDSESRIESNLDGWFRYRALKEFYQIQERKTDLATLEETQREIASQAIIKLALVGIIPVIAGLTGLGLLIFLCIQLGIKKEQAIIFINKKLAWETPWNLETVWQVLMVGFFFVGQIILPILFGFIPIDLTHLSLRGKAFYVLGSYLALSLAGIGVLYLSIKPFLPLPKDWFNVKENNWITWGVGGYLVAVPLVVIVSLINQKIWDGQGGSNPLLFLALEAQDMVALAIFYFTAAIAAPFYEEVMFRGFLLPSLTRYVPVWGAIAISSLIFAVAHLNLSEVLPLAILGMVLGVVYTRSRNLLSSMLLHSLWNSGTLLSLFLLGSGGN